MPDASMLASDPEPKPESEPKVFHFYDPVPPPLAEPTPSLGLHGNISCEDESPFTHGRRSATVLVVKEAGKLVAYIGLAYCCPKDNFSHAEGRRSSEARARALMQRRRLATYSTALFRKRNDMTVGKRTLAFRATLAGDFGPAALRHLALESP